MLQERKNFDAFIQNTWYIENENREIVDLVHGKIMLYLTIMVPTILKSLKCLIQGRWGLF